MNHNQALQDFLQQQQLPAQFFHLAEACYLPLAEKLAQQHELAERPLFVGINGSQGSGKSTLASLLTLLLSQVHGLKAVDTSIDDFYLPRAARLSLANRVHPLLATRGVPGTHDLPLMQQTLERLGRQGGELAIPRFDKSVDDHFPVTDWDKVIPPLDIIIIEGWCLGTPPQTDAALREPVNRLEAEEDPDGIWRHYVNRQIECFYLPVYQLIDNWIMLQAPSFDCVYRWRLQQENKLASRLNQADARSTSSDRIMSEKQIGRFIQHYQRLTEHALRQLPDRVNYLFRLDADRQIVASSEPQKDTTMFRDMAC